MGGRAMDGFGRVRECRCMRYPERWQRLKVNRLERNYREMEVQLAIFPSRGHIPHSTRLHLSIICKYLVEVAAPMLPFAFSRQCAGRAAGEQQIFNGGLE